MRHAASHRRAPRRHLPFHRPPPRRPYAPGAPPTRASDLVLAVLGVVLLGWLALVAAHALAVGPALP